MLTLTPEEFVKLLGQKAVEIKQLLNNDLPVIIGVTARNYFADNFQSESWERTKWPEVKRRLPSWERKGKAVNNPTKGAKRSRKILTGDTGDLGKSIQYTPETGKVTIHSDLIYAAVHNFGLKAGRGSGFTMPQRQFIGESEELNAKIKTIIENKLQKILNP